MIVTLAGHVDHGKTSLVQALTGVNTDRLEEEKRRGLTIDLGFAYIDDGAIGFVDVPGHHRFIHNMVAGVASQQYALLVIAADDGPMPQSREHLDILELVGVTNGCIALTKCDRVDDAQLKQAREHIQSLVAGTFMAQGPVFETAITETESITPLLEHLRSVNHQQQATQSHSPFRLAVDRSFVVKGAGVVVTGTVHDGALNEGDEVFLFPSGKAARVRSLRTQDRPADRATGGDRCAINLAGINANDVQRGNWILAQPHHGVTQLTLELNVLPHYPRPVKHWTQVHVYYATSHSTGNLALLSNWRLAPGEHTTVDLVCDTPVCAQHGDRVIVRDFGLDMTVGGGRVIHTEAQSTQRRRHADRQAQLQALAADDNGDALNALLKLGPVDLSAFQASRGLTAAAMQELASPLVLVDQWAFDAATWRSFGEQALAQLKQQQQENRSAPGLKQNEFKDIPESALSQVLGELLQKQTIEQIGGIYKLPSHAAELPDALAKFWKRVEPELNVMQAPSTGDLSKQWRIPQTTIEKSLKELVRRGLLIHVANHRFYLPSQIDAVKQLIVQTWPDTPFSVKQFRDHTGIGRNIAIEILEYLDSRGFTRRQGNERVVLKTGLR